MSTTTRSTSVHGRSPWLIVGQAAAALAAGIGVGRFVYTPILPLMHAQAGLSAELGASLATANYIGYLVGALAGTFVPALVRSVNVLRGSLVILIATLALMPVTHDGAVWFGLRLIAGVASALIFVIAVSAALTRLRGQVQHLTGWAFGGVGTGIALSGLLVLLLRSATTWQAAWWSCAGLAAVLAAAAWGLTPAPQPAAAGQAAAPDPPRTHRWFWPLFGSYSLEGIGYIIAGTFLVAAIEQSVPGPLGSGAWILVGLAALPSSALWAWLAHRWSRPSLLFAALTIQVVGVTLPALLGGVAPALISAVLFGGTFMGVSTLALAIGTHLRGPRAVALLTAGYSAGQILGPMLAAPLLQHGYRQALLLGGAVVLAAVLAAVGVWIRFPQAQASPALLSRSAQTPD
ncbi:YbfB/YjiJ family MFS transporter [Nonomuraea sp. NEAU-A123]|nr:YbfB/YjiJ family MFS transporter [Nonomuraea sp. NEAU-A123]MBT2227283.1 YbfB/YjiJ family MFS transporter [Nonomuraea sp. NEAU-A123]